MVQPWLSLYLMTPQWGPPPLTGSLVCVEAGDVDFWVAGRRIVRLCNFSPILPGVAENSWTLKFGLKLIWLFRKTFALSVMYMLSVFRTILILANLNRNFPEFRSTCFRNSLTLSGSSKIRFSNLRVFESLFALEDAVTCSLWECDKAGIGGSPTWS